MSKILKRPMFRKGGEVTEGIVSMAQPRKNYSLGPGPNAMDDQLAQKAQRYANIAQKVIGSDASYDPVARFLIDFGQSYASARPMGKGITGAISTAAAAAKEPTKALYEGLDKQGTAKKQLALFGLQQAFGENLALMKNLTAPEKDELMRRAKKYAEVYKIPLEEAQKIMLKRFVEGTPPKGLTQQNIYMSELKQLNDNPLTRTLPDDEKRNIAKTSTEIFLGNAPNAATAPYSINNLDKKKLTEFTIGKNYINPADGFIYNLQNDGKFKKIWPSN
jgi:hypothetical protein